MMKKQNKISLIITSIILVLVCMIIYHALSSKSENPSSYSSAESIISALPAGDTSIGQRERIVAPTNFPQTGNQVEDFVLAPYEISMEAHGLLDEDELEDAVLVLENKSDPEGARPTLVLKQTTDGSYELKAKSLKAIGSAYINGDFKQYDSEELKIDSNRLTITTYSIGAVGNRKTQYRFINNELILVYMETYNMGAGGHTGVVYDFLDQLITVTEVNTIKEEMPSTQERTKMNPHKPYLFENIDPTEIL